MKKLVKCFILLLSLVITGMVLIGCEAEDSKGNNDISFKDLELFVDDYEAIVLNYSGERDTVTYSGYDESVISVRNGMVRALAPGSTEVTITGNNYGGTGKFKVTVSYKPGSTEMESFNKAGTFDEENPLELWTISGATANYHIVEIDTEGGNETSAYKLWYEEGAACDVALEYKLTNMPAGVYTFTMKIRGGAFDEVECDINDTVSKWSEGKIYINKNTTYIVYELLADGDIDFKLSFVGSEQLEEDATSPWGFVDDIKIEEGDTAPDNLVNSLTVNYSFEEGTEGWTYEKSETFSGELTTYSSTAAGSGAYALSYWGAGSSTDSIKLSQVVSSVAAGNYQLSISIILGCDDTTVTEIGDSYLYIKNYDGQDGILKVDVKAITGWNEGTMVTYTIDDIAITNSDVEVGVVFTMQYNTVWIHFDDIILQVETE